MRGDLEPLCALIEQRYSSVLSNRGYRWSNELLVKFAFLTPDHAAFTLSSTSARLVAPLGLG